MKCQSGAVSRYGAPTSFQSSPCDEKNRTCDVVPVAEGETCHAGTEREGRCKAGVCEPSGGGCSVGGRGEGVGAVLVVLAVVIGVIGRRKRTGNREPGTGNREVRGCS